MDGAQGRNRTTDTAIFSRMLYQLSYLGGCTPSRRSGSRLIGGLVAPCPAQAREQFRAGSPTPFQGAPHRAARPSICRSRNCNASRRGPVIEDRAHARRYRFILFRRLRGRGLPVGRARRRGRPADRAVELSGAWPGRRRRRARSVGRSFRRRGRFGLGRQGGQGRGRRRDRLEL